MYLNKLNIYRKNVNRINITLFTNKASIILKYVQVRILIFKQLKRSTNNEALLEKSSQRGKNTTILMRL